ncbi:hypothetical protein BDN70DRAFT_269967 [Pholiota conissans]|uniref:F-box domain-containing protein n=1 Tax=Pholiota conissans TaxID=109636 RepID=A0A9P5YWJ9_9AGAR|nr:hypothetical protein BDN70DRAFT_269967 [Pholiota conissans]
MASTVMSAITSSSRRLGKKTKTKVPGDVDQNTHQRHLPFEIWSLVFSHLSTSDLTSVARVSRTFLPICRSALYRSVTLRSDNPNHIYTFNVLEHIKDLTGSVKHATFYTAWTPWMPAMPTTTWVDIDVFALLTGLRTLTLIGCPFILPDEQTKFVEVVGKRCPALRGFTYVPLYSMAFPSPSLEIRGLEFVTWPTFLCTVFSKLD